jgi:hypothetical protein
VITLPNIDEDKNKDTVNHSSRDDTRNQTSSSKGISKKK